MLMPMMLSAALAPAPASGEYPSRPVRLVVPFPAGGPSDAAARIVAQALAPSLGQPMIVENRPGADGAIAAQSVAASPADGHTLLWATNAVLALAVMSKPAPFDTLVDFAPVGSVGRFAFGMYVHPGVPSQNLGDFLGYARANPGKLNYASSNLAEQLAAAQFMKVAGVDMVRIPYKGSAQLMPDLIAGRVQVNFGPVGGAVAHAKEGRIRMLATLLPQRTALTPDVPTTAEAGLPGVSVSSHQMILAPARTPQAAIDRLSRELDAALRDAEVRAQLARLALTVEPATPEQLAASIRDAERTWAQFFREAGVAAQ